MGVCEEKVCKGAAVQRGLEHGSREIAIVSSYYQKTSNEDTAGKERVLQLLVRCGNQRRPCN
jgi:hypothetical protein